MKQVSAYFDYRKEKDSVTGIAGPNKSGLAIQVYGATTLKVVSELSFGHPLWLRETSFGYWCQKLGA